ncbi:hypothetical protein RCL1_004955 [Eukaryota sp. TZLM3-RCL]
MIVFSFIFPYFGLICGDRYVSAFDRGLLLVLSLNIKFANREEKQSFEVIAGAFFGSIVSASTNIQKFANENNLNGFVSIQAFQRGGDPSRLAHILRKDAAGEYYALSCDSKNMKNCVSAASGLLNYAQSDFTKQFNFGKGVGLTPLGTGFTEHRPIKYIGLTPSKSFVISSVQQQRITLANELKKAQYYEGNFEQLLKYYLVSWNSGSRLYQSIISSYDKAKTNINLILSPFLQEELLVVLKLQMIATKFISPFPVVFNQSMTCRSWIQSGITLNFQVHCFPKWRPFFFLESNSQNY